MVTISGTNLAGATLVNFGSFAATIQSDTATQIVVLSPAGAAGTVDVTVTTANGTSATSSADLFAYTAAAQPATVGLYDPSASAFYLRNSDTAGSADTTFAYGPANSNWITHCRRLEWRRHGHHRLVQPNHFHVLPER